jgi:hypothetical protein
MPLGHINGDKTFEAIQKVSAGKTALFCHQQSCVALGSVEEGKDKEEGCSLQLYQHKSGQFSYYDRGSITKHLYRHPFAGNRCLL